jgi:hypothetical protein
MFTEFRDLERRVLLVVSHLKGAVVMLHSAALFGSMHIKIYVANSNCTKSH